MSRHLRVILLGVVIGLLILAGWFSVVMPSVLASHLQSAVQARTGRALDYMGGSHLRFLPHPSITLNDVRLSGSSALADPVLTAKTLTVPLSLAQLVSGRAAATSINLDQAVLNMDINGLGHSNVIIDAPASDSKTDAGLPLPHALHITFSNSRFEYRDEVRAIGFAMNDMVGLIDVDEEDVITIKGDGSAAGERAHFNGTLKSLPRAFGEGSPLDFNLEGAGASFGFSGRVVAALGLDLAGQATLDSTDAKRSLNWLGLKLQGLHQGLSLSIAGAIENQGPLFLLKKVDVEFAHMKASGDVSYNKTGDRPRITLALGADNLDFNIYGDGAKATSDGWNDSAFDLADFAAADVQFRLAANQLSYGAFNVAEAKIEGELKDANLKAAITSAKAGKMDVQFDGHALPAKIDVNFGLTSVDAQKFLGSFVGFNWLSGPANFNGSLNATGASAAAMVGALEGAVDVQFEQGKLAGVELAGLAAHTTTSVVNGWEGASTESVAATAHLDLNDGVATLGEASITAPGLKIIPAGEIDVLRQALNLQTQVSLNRGDGLPLKISVNGPWAKPQFKAGN